MATHLLAEAVIKGVDRFSAPMGKMAANATMNAQKMANMGVMAKKMSKQVNMASSSIGKMGRGMQGPGSMVMSVASGNIIHGMAKWDEAARKAQATALVWKDIDYKPVRDKIMQLGRIYPAMPIDIAGGTRELHMAGMKVNEVLSEAMMKDYETGKYRKFSVLEMMVQGALAAGEDFKVVGAGVTDVIMSMDLPWKTVEDRVKSFKKVNDLLAHGSSLYNQDYSPFLDTLKYAAPVAKAVGMDIVKLIALSGALADAGMKGSMAGTGMRAMLIKPLGLSGTTRRMLKAKWGVQLDNFIVKSKNPRLRSGKYFAEFIAASTGFDVRTMSKDFDRILKDSRFDRNSGLMGDKLMDIFRKNMDLSGKNKILAPVINEAVRDYASAGFSQLRLVPLLKRMGEQGMTPGDVADIFGLRHVPKALALIDQLMSGKFREKYDRIVRNYQDAAAKKAAIQMRGTLGDMKTMFSAFNAVPKIMMERSGVWNDMGGQFRLITSGLNVMADSSPGLQKLALYSVMALGAMAPLGFAFMGIGSSVGVLTGGLGLVASIGAPALLALGVGAKFLYDNWESFSGLTTKKFFGGLINGAMVADDLIRSLANSVKSLFGYGEKVAGSSGALAAGAGKAAGLYGEKSIRGFLMRQSVGEGGTGPWTWVSERWNIASEKISGLFAGMGRKIKAGLGGAWSWLAVSAGSVFSILNSDVKTFGKWIGDTTKSTSEFFTGLFGGLSDQWKGSELSWLFKQIDGAINNMFGPAARDGAEKQGQGLARALFNPMATFGKGLSGEYGTAGFIASGAIAQKLIGSFAHVGASLAIVATALGRLGFVIGKPIAKLLLLTKGFGKLSRVAKFASLAGRFTVVGAAVTALYLSWNALSEAGSRFAKGFKIDTKGLTEVDILVNRVKESLKFDVSSPSYFSAGPNQASWGQAFEAYGKRMRADIERAAKGLNNFLDNLPPPDWSRITPSLDGLETYKAAWQNLVDDVSAGIEHLIGLFPSLQFPEIPKWIKSSYSYMFRSTKSDQNFIADVPHLYNSKSLGGYTKSTDRFNYYSGLVGDRPFVDSILNSQSRARRKPENQFSGASGFSAPFGTPKVDITGQVEAVLKGRGRVDVQIRVDESPSLRAAIASAKASDDGGHVAPNVGVSNPGAATGE